MNFKDNIDFVNLDIELINPDEKFAVYYRNNEPTNFAVSTEGRVYNMKTNTLRKVHTMKNGYRSINLSFGSSECHTCSLHRMVAETFIDGWDPENGIDTVDHLNGPDEGDNIRNLEWVTHQENLRRASDKGWMKRKEVGENSACSKYTEKQVRKACEMKENKIDHRMISEQTGISYDYLGKIFNGLKWAHVVCDYNLENSHFYPKEMRARVIELVKRGRLSNSEIREVILSEFNIELKKSYVKDIKRSLKKQEGSTTIESVLRIEID